MLTTPSKRKQKQFRETTSSLLAMLMATSVGDHPRKGKLSQLVTAKKKRRTKSVDSNCSSITDPMSPDRRDYKRRFNMDKLDKSDRQSVPIAAAHSYEAVAAIDFGTTYSGYAYAFTRDPDNIHLMNQRMVSHRSGYGVQQPTVLLLNNKGEFHSFGYDAQEFFHDLDEEECGQWLYFEKFKMELHSREHLHQGMELEAANGVKLPALFVFAQALNYFKMQCLQEICDRSTANVSVRDIQWVITVPAIWRPSAKQFMRRVAMEAGLVTEANPKQLVIALEPEAASVYCRQLQLRECVMTSRSSPSPSTGAPKYSTSSISTGSSTGSPPQSLPIIFNEVSTPPDMDTAQRNRSAADIHPGVKYLVADCGGGTVDLTLHQLEDTGHLRELYKATGGAWGSIGVDCQFEMLLVSIFGEPFVEQFVKQKAVSWLELMNNFEAKKRTFNPSKDNPTSITLPFAFIDDFHRKTKKTVSQAVAAYGDESVQWSSHGSLRLLPGAMMDLFGPVVSTVVQHITKLLAQPEVGRIEYLFLVGGFADSPVLQQAIRKRFANDLTVIIPQDVSLTILKGAVMFGLDPSTVQVRRSALTYGVACLNKYNPQLHPDEKKVVKDGQVWCTDIFDTFVSIGQAVPNDHHVTRSYNIARSGLKSTVITLFCSNNEVVKFITDPGVTKIGELHLQMPDTTGGRSRELKTTMIFGNTEVSVQAVDCTSGQTAHAEVDFFIFSR